MEKTEVSSLAKINFGLEVAGLRPDGYHELRTLFQTISLGDRLIFRPGQEDKILLTGDLKDITWDENNLIYQAAINLKQEARAKPGVEIEVQKIIPRGEGWLAAAVMRL